MKSKKESIDIESVTFQQSELLERVIVSIGMTLCNALVRAERYDEIIALREIAGEFALLASVYGEQTNRIPESLGVSLGEAIEFKLQSIKAQDGSNEWRHYLADDEAVLEELSKR
jgi:hypothetical protein